MSPQDHRAPDALDDLDSETIEDLDVGDAADDIAGGTWAGGGTTTIATVQ